MTEWLIDRRLALARLENIMEKLTFEEAFDNGCIAADLGEMRCANPFGKDDENFAAWDQGWIAATETNQIFG